MVNGTIISKYSNIQIFLVNFLSYNRGIFSTYNRGIGSLENVQGT